ncbi:hypothetical protein B296_00032230 [Ensete ventricosum]|uniref:Uncharacterized protein n=1 Tax=Ensete ventricosum TaxID=4639 RepID=A0A427AE92_ENSVE|nr:hypothetical protein B296_00032230 [Ensete ventricosum]
MRLPRSNEATPRLTMRERGDTSSSRAGTRHCLVFLLGAPRLLAQERGAALFSREARRGDASSVFNFF